MMNKRTEFVLRGELDLIIQNLKRLEARPNGDQFNIQKLRRLRDHRQRKLWEMEKH